MKIEVSTTNDHSCWVGGNYFIRPSDWANLGPTMIIDLPDGEIDDDYRARLVEQGGALLGLGGEDMRYLLAKLGIFQFVWLIDFDGERTLRRKRKCKDGRPWVKRVGLGTRNCILNDDGTVCDDRCYVQNWKPF